jgi:GNAT superfamily N-acetyltransferase
MAGLGPGLTLRRPTPDDFGAVLATVQAAGIADDGAPSYTEQELRADWAERDLGADAWVVAAADGRIVGYADVAARGADKVDADGDVHPAETGRGVGTALVRATEGWAADVLAARPNLASVVVGNAVNGRNAAARALPERESYAEARI